MRSILLALILTACQSYTGGVQAICDTPSACPACTTGAPEARMAALGKHLDANVTNRSARNLMGALASADPATKAKLLRDEAAKVGIENCALADTFTAGKTGE